jgi:acyl-coenzyme A synthetase/AMP-(fatty) acid ligase
MAGYTTAVFVVLKPGIQPSEELKNEINHPYRKRE